MLNAFRHHGVYRGLQIHHPAPRPQRCSTPFGITEYIGCRRRPASGCRGTVLNAFRHHGVYRNREYQNLHPAPVVLNAFRHHGVYRAGAGGGGGAGGGECSTPFGITEYIGSDSWPTRRCRLPVLNAFRHHGVYRRPLSASPRGGTHGAQRLSASRSISVPLPAISLCGTSRCSTPFGITEYIGPRRARGRQDAIIVLNAFRHHGVYRWTTSSSRPALASCSTPFGITEYIGRALPWVGPVSTWTSAQRLSASRSISDSLQGAPTAPCQLVLNAFRHHGVYRTAAVTLAQPGRSRCSTPFGITEYIGPMSSAAPGALP